jgi:hypothetical protein
MRKSKKFKNLQAKVLTYIKRGTKVENGKEKDMLDYIEKSQYYKDILDKMATDITKKWDL